MTVRSIAYASIDDSPVTFDENAIPKKRPTAPRMRWGALVSERSLTARAEH
jgi:hypothetical protein